ncbi:MAG: hypothetical protein ACYTGH_03075 [Planctomycetota bacterium]|jgi:hypothetical protein
MNPEKKRPCHDCGAGNPDDAMLCSLCGKSFREEGVDTPTLSSPELDPDPPADSNRAVFAVLGCGGVALIGLAVLAYFLLTLGSQEGEQEAQSTAEGSTSSASEGEAASTAKAISVFSLNDITITASARDIRTTSLSIKGTNLPEVILIPAGAQLIPQAESEAIVPRIVHRDTQVKSHARRKSASIGLTTLNAKFTGTKNAPAKTPYTLKPPKDNESLSQVFLTRLQEREMVRWGLAQVGVWLINDPTLTRKQLNQIHIVTSGGGYMGMAPATSARIGSTRTYRDLQSLFDELEESLGDYALFVEMRADLERVLTVTNPKKPDRLLSNYLRADTLDKYRDEALESHFITFATGSYEQIIRRKALEALCLNGIRGTNEALFEQALKEEENPRLRLIAAATLFKRKDDRILPLLGALMRDPALAAPLDHRYDRHIASLEKNRRVRVRRDEKESHWDLWLRQVGWEKIDLSDPLNQRIREATKALLAVAGNETILQESLTQLTATDVDTRRGAIENLKRHCATRKEAFDALVALARTEKSQSVRSRAQCALSAFTTFDTRSIWMALLKEKERSKDIYYLLYEATNQKLPWAGEFLIAATRHPETYVRSNACSLLKPDLHKDWDTAIAAAALNETHSKTFFKMVYQLHRYKSKKGAEPLMKAIDRGREKDRVRVAELLLEHHSDHAEGKALARERLRTMVEGGVKMSTSYRARALTALVRHDPKAGLPLAKAAIQNTKNPIRRSAVYSLRNHHPGKEDLKAFLKSYESDSTIGRAVKQYLEQ